MAGSASKPNAIVDANGGWQVARLGQPGAGRADIGLAHLAVQLVPELEVDRPPSGGGRCRWAAAAATFASGRAIAGQDISFADVLKVAEAFVTWLREGR